MWRYLIFILLFPVFYPSSCHRAEPAKSQGPVRSALVKPAPILTPLDSLQLALDSLKRDTALVHASLAWDILDYSKGNAVPVSSFNEELSLVPASTIKILTTGAALEILGEKAAFRTALQYDGVIGNHKLTGNLYIRGGGDPTFGSDATLDRWVKAVADLGIDTIEGSVIGDARIFSRVTIPLTWTWGELQLPYSAPASGLSFNGNVYSGTSDRGETKKFSPDTGKIKPFLPQAAFRNDVSDAEEPEAETYVVGDPYSYSFLIQGTVLQGQSFFPYAGVIPDPPYIAALELKNRLAGKGIFVTGDALDLYEADSAVLATVQKTQTDLAYAWSPPVATLVTLTNLYSNNFFAEHLLKQIGLKKYKYGSSEAGCRAVSLFWKSKNLNTDGLFLFDGCGISRYDAVTARQMAEALFYMTTSPEFTTFYNSLPLAGVSGTLAHAFQGTAAAGNIRAKTGTISRVKSYAGYIRTRSGKRLIFSLLLNNFTCRQDQVKQKLERILLKMVSL
ncbi:MAG TPA: D-alanyl-D-alanine carboxypeptidase/D-alanyl-D-alanine-endopeptidase [Bacteroidales bacterium]|nr:D-alanyl-D-alanine carboxypeptidase/D-alanyl-D-alanine-endopeptidase [Bacteroidales bacterium]